MSSEKEFKDISKSVALKKYYTDEDQIGDEFCARVKCDACFGSDENGESNGYGCTYREAYVDENDHLIVDYDEAYDFAKDELEEKDKEIARLKAENARLNISLNTCKNDFWFMTNLLEKYSSNKQEAINACIERMKFRKPIFGTLREVDND